MLARMSFSSLNARTLLFARPLFTVIENMELKREKKRRNPGPVGWLGRRLQKKNTALSPSFFPSSSSFIDVSRVVPYIPPLRHRMMGG